MFVDCDCLGGGYPRISGKIFLFVTRHCFLMDQESQVFVSLGAENFQESSKAAIFNWCAARIFKIQYLTI